jgi:phosphoglycolate phosphatase
MAIRAIIWDFDGTLASSLDGIASSMRETLAFFGHAVPTKEEVRATVGLTLEDCMRRLTRGACPEDRIPLLVGKYRSLHLANAAPRTSMFDGAMKVLSELRRGGIASVVVSNKGRVGLNQLIEQLGINDLITFALSSDDVAFHKPDKRLFTEHVEPLINHLPAGDVIVIGDTDIDIRFGEAAGLKVCWAKYGYGDPGVCSALQPTHTLESIVEALGIIEYYG